MKPHSNIQARTRLLCYDARCFRLSFQILLPALSALGRISRALSHWLLVGVVQWGAPAGNRREGEGIGQCSYFLGSLSAKLLRISCALGWNITALPRMYVHTFLSLYSPDCPLSLLFQYGGNVIVACDFLVLFKHLPLVVSFGVLCSAGGGDPD